MRKRSRTVLKAIRSYRHFYDSMMDACVGMDLSGNILNANGAFEKLLGFGRKELSKAASAELTPEKWRETEADVIKNQVLTRGYSGIYEKELVRKGGEIFPVEVKTFLIKDDTGKPVSMWSIVRDITDRKMMERALRESEIRYRTLTEWSPEPLVVHRAGKLIYANPAAVRLIGAESATELLGRSILDFVHPEFHAVVLERAHAATAEDAKLPLMKEKFIKLDGTILYVEVQAANIAFDGEPAVQVAIRDITARVTAEEESRKNVHWWRALYDHSPLPTFVWEEAGSDWILASYNHAAEQFTQGAIADKIGIHARIFYADSPEIISAFSQARKLKYVQMKEMDYLVRSTGETKIVSVTYTFVPEKFIVVTVVDETERTRSLTALRESEAHMRLIAESIPGPVSHIGKDGRYAYINRHYETWFGDQRADVIGRTPQEVLKPELLALIEPYFRQVARGESVSWEADLTTVDGKRLTAQVNHIPDVDAAGGVRGLFTVVFDVSKQKQAEKALRKSLREKELLLAEVHHRVKNNLQIISSLIAMQSQSTRDTSTIMHMANLAMRVRAMGLLHTQLYASADFGRIEIRDYLTSIINQILSIGTVNKRAVELSIDIPETFLNIETSLPIGLVVNEIVSNALNHALRTVEYPRLSVELKVCAALWRLKICDNGPGIPADLDIRSTLGLRLITVLVRQIHGKLQVSEGPGACVTIEFQEQKKEERRWGQITDTH